MGFSIGASGGGRGGAGHFLHHLSTREDTGRISGRVLLRLLRFVQPYWRHMTGAAVLMLIASGTGALTPLLTKVAIDDNILALEPDMSGLVRTCVLLAIAMAANYLEERDSVVAHGAQARA